MNIKSLRNFNGHTTLLGFAACVVRYFGLNASLKGTYTPLKNILLVLNN